MNSQAIEITCLTLNFNLWPPKSNQFIFESSWTLVLYSKKCPYVAFKNKAYDHTTFDTQRLRPQRQNGRNLCKSNRTGISPRTDRREINVACAERMHKFTMYTNYCYKYLISMKSVDPGGHMEIAGSSWDY